MSARSPPHLSFRHLRESYRDDGPLAVAVVGDLAVSTLLTLFVVPSAHMILNTGAERLARWLVGGESDAPTAIRSGRGPVPGGAGAD